MAGAGIPQDGPLNDDLGPIHAINVTPFVDVVLVLLVIFMVTAPALLKDVIGVQLPKTVTSDAKANASLGIAINAQGQILVNGVPVTEAELGRAVVEQLRVTPDLQAIISADQNARHGDLVRAIDVIKQAGLNRFALQVVREGVPTAGEPSP